MPDKRFQTKLLKIKDYRCGQNGGRFGTRGTAKGTTDLDLGEWAVTTRDGKLYLRMGNRTRLSICRASPDMIATIIGLVTSVLVWPMRHDHWRRHNHVIVVRNTRDSRFVPSRRRPQNLSGSPRTKRTLRQNRSSGCFETRRTLCDATVDMAHLR